MLLQQGVGGGGINDSYVIKIGIGKLMTNDDNGGRGSKKRPKYDDLIVEWPQRSLKNI